MVLGMSPWLLHPLPPTTTVNLDMPCIWTMLARGADVVDTAIKAVPPATNTVIWTDSNCVLVYWTIVHHICIPLG